MSSPSVDVLVEGAKELRRELRALGGPKLRTLAKQVVSSRMNPVLALARSSAPVVSGRLSKSLGKVVGANRRGDAFTARVGPRRDFVYKNTAGEKLVSGRGKVRDRAIAKGISQDTKTAQQYARLIETGFDSHGRNRRKAGAANFLENSIESYESSIVSGVVSDLRGYLETNT